ncbi:MAG: hypothetical protein H7336_07880 [Bacteriovorax sp.]|nr:hypothetical protein [Bacteriovorax sp.]
MVQNTKENSEKKQVDVKKSDSEKHIAHRHNKSTQKNTKRRDPSGLPKYR